MPKATTGLRAPGAASILGSDRCHRCKGTAGSLAAATAGCAEVCTTQPCSPWLDSSCCRSACSPSTQLSAAPAPNRSRRPRSSSSWSGAALTLPYYDAEDFALHAVAQRAAEGHLLDLVDAIRTGSVAITTSGIGLLLLGVGAVLTGVAVWRSGVLPRYSAIPFAVGFVLFCRSSTHLPRSA